MSSEGKRYRIPICRTCGKVREVQASCVCPQGVDWIEVAPASEVERLTEALQAGLRLANVVNDFLGNLAIATGDLDAKQEAETLMGLALGAFREALRDAGFDPYTRAPLDARHLDEEAP